jgi:CRISPR-associated exonuclease Cas4
MYIEDDFLMLSGIQHFVFCRRQWALIDVEQQWADNVRTVEGNLLHQKAHDNDSREKRGDLIITRAMPIQSREMGVSGECDVVEFHKDKSGVEIFGDRYQVIPIEYKKGKPAEAAGKGVNKSEANALQLVAQAMCLEEMLCCRIDYGYLYYGEVRRRVREDCTPERRDAVRQIFSEMHKYMEQGYTPKVKRTKSCNACSLKDICLSVLEKRKSASKYMEQAMEE